MDSHLVQVLLLMLEELEQWCHNLFVLSTRKRNAPCWRRGRKLLHHKLLRHQIFMSQMYMYIKKTHNFPLISLWSANFKCVKLHKSSWIHCLVSFQDLKLSTKDIVVLLKDTLNTTSGLPPIPNPHVTWVPSNTLERHLIGSFVVDGVCNLVTSYNMAKLEGSPSFDSTFTYQKGAKNTSIVDLLLNKCIVDSHSLRKVFHSFLKVVQVKELPSPLELPLSTILSQQFKWEDIHLKWYFLIQVPNQWFLKFNLPKRWACSTLNYKNLFSKFASLVRA